MTVEALSFHMIASRCGQCLRVTLSDMQRKNIGSFISFPTVLTLVRTIVGVGGKMALPVVLLLLSTYFTYEDDVNKGTAEVLHQFLYIRARR